MKYIAASLTLALTLAGGASAGTSHIAQGLFCNTHEQIAATLGGVAEGLSMQQAVAMSNQDKVVCVWADKIGYMVTAPMPVESIEQNGVWVQVFEARLVGILVGDNPRPVEPPVQIYFVPSEKIPSSVLTRGS